MNSQRHHQLRFQLEESHKDLKQWFLMHQECLLLGDDHHAALAFDGFQAYLLAHLRFENNNLLSQDVHDLRWAVKVYRKEHDKLEQMLEKSVSLLRGYYLLEGRRKRVALLEVLDFQRSFLHVMEHHEEREEQDLFLKLTYDADTLSLWSDVSAQLQRFDHVRETLKALLARDE